MCVARDVLQCECGANKQTFVRKVKSAIMEKETIHRLENDKSRKHQGQFLHVIEEAEARIWSFVVLQLTPQMLHFSMNASQDTLPYDANLCVEKE